MPINNMCLNSDSSRQNELWTLISSCTLWHIWKARCQRLFGNIVVPPREVIRSTWQEMVITLKAKYDEIKGDRNLVVVRSLAFHKIWNNMGFYSIHNA